jgi:hypothetical protein
MMVDRSKIGESQKCFLGEIALGETHDGIIEGRMEVKRLTSRTAGGTRCHSLHRGCHKEGFSRNHQTDLSKNNSLGGYC